MRNKVLRSFLNHFKNQLGMSLVETVVGFGLSSVVLMGVLGTLKLTETEQRTLRKSAQITEWINTISAILADSKSCGASFAGSNPGVVGAAKNGTNGENVPALWWDDTGAGDISEIQAGANVGGARIDTMSLTNIQVHNATKGLLRIGLRVNFFDEGRPLPKTFYFIAKMVGAPPAAPAAGAGIEKCFGEIDEEIMKEEFCATIAGSFTAGTCNVMIADDGATNMTVDASIENLEANIQALQTTLTESKDQVCFLATDLCDRTAVCNTTICDNLDFGSTRTAAECDALPNGETVSVVHNGVTGNICRVSDSACPAGWRRFYNWSTTAPNDCARPSSCDGPIWADPPPTSSHAWADTPVESTSRNECLTQAHEGKCGTTAGEPNVCTFEADGTNNAPVIRASACFAFVTQIGCF